MKEKKLKSRNSKKMSSAIKVLLCIVIVIIALISAFYVVLYLSVPSYSFKEPTAFTGDFIYNPYQDVKKNRWQYLDFRGDSTDRAGIPVYEYGYGFSSTRYLCINYKTKRKIDYPFFQNIHFKQYNIDCLCNDCSLVVLAHPSKGFKLRDMRYLDHYRMLEVISPYGRAFDYCDLALSSGHRVSIIGSTGLANNDAFICKTVVNVENKDKKGIIKSLESGGFYVIYYKYENKNVPFLKELSLKGDTLSVLASQQIEEVRFIGQNGELKESLNNVNQGDYLFKDNDTYIRTELTFADGTEIYLNPVVRHKFRYFFDSGFSSVMIGRTWLMRIVYLVAIIFFVRYLLLGFKERKSKNNENKKN